MLTTKTLNWYAHCEKLFGQAMYRYIDKSSIKSFNKPVHVGTTMEYELGKAYSITAEGSIDLKLGKVHEVPLAKFLKPNIRLEVKPTLKCNYSCKHCWERVGAPKRTESESFIQNCKALNTALKTIAFNFEHNELNIHLLGGELTFVDETELLSGLRLLFDSVPTLNSIKFITNGSSTVSTINKVIKLLTPFCKELQLLVSFHDATLSSRKAQQSFFRKILQLSCVLSCSIFVILTVDRRNQSLQKPLNLLSYSYNKAFKASFKGLIYLDDDSSARYDLKEGWINKDIGFMAWNKTSNLEVCNGMMTHYQLYIANGDIFFITQCTMHGQSSIDGSPFRKTVFTTPLDSNIEEFILNKKLYHRPSSCELLPGSFCDVCEDVSTISYATAEENKVKYLHLVRRP